MKAREKIVAVALLSHEDVMRFGFMLSQVYRIDETPCFEELLQTLDYIDQRRRSASGSHGIDEQANDPSSSSFSE